MDERKVTLQAIRLLSQVSEKILSKVAVREDVSSRAIDAALHCVDKAEHIAQYDIDDLSPRARMDAIVEAMDFLLRVLVGEKELLSTSGLLVPSIEDVQAVVSDGTFLMRSRDKGIETGFPLIGEVPNAAVEAIQFALTAEDGMTWLRLWNEGEFDTCRREWPEAPDVVYIGADSLLPATRTIVARPVS